MKKQILSLALFAGMTLTGVSVFAAEDTMMKHMSVVDVTNGQEYRGVITPATAGGNAYINYSDGEFSLEAKLSELSDPLGDDFYEGWLVRRSPFDFISTGVLKKEGDVYVDVFSSSIDYSDYDFYVLTLEPNDGDPAPADHIVEGDVMMAKTMDDTMMDKSDMMKNELTAKQKALRVHIKERLANIDVSKIDIEIVKKRMNDYRAGLDERNLTDSKRKKIEDVLDAILDVVMEMKMMSSDTMMDK